MHYFPFYTLSLTDPSVVPKLYETLGGVHMAHSYVTNQLQGGRK